MPKIDFGFGGSGSNEPQEPITDLETGKVVDDPTGQTTGLGDDNKPVDKPADKPADNAGNDKPTDGDKPAGDGNKPADDKFGDLVAGTVISIGEESYTVDSEGNLVDKYNKIFKEAAEVKEYLAQFEVDENKETPIDVDSIIKAVGVEVTDENDKPITFDNTPEGIAQYVNEVIELQKQEIAQAGVQTLLDKYPIVADFLNYYVANGNDARGFGEVKDRSSITIDENNIAQQEAIIREAYKENKRHGDVDAYIKYLNKQMQLLKSSKLKKLKPNLKPSVKQKLITGTVLKLLLIAKRLQVIKYLILSLLTRTANKLQLLLMISLIISIKLMIKVIVVMKEI